MKKAKEKYQAVVLTAGFIYVGWVRRTKDRVYMRDAKNLRYWSGEGLGPCLTNGPPENSKIDKCGDIVIEKSALHHTIDAVAKHWV